MVACYRLIFTEALVRTPALSGRASRAFAGVGLWPFDTCYWYVTLALAFSHSPPKSRDTVRPIYFYLRFSLAT